jgi:hypothetical protein
MKYGLCMVGGEAREHRGELVDRRRLTLAGTTLPIPTDALLLWLLTVGRPRAVKLPPRHLADRPVSLGARE